MTPIEAGYLALQLKKVKSSKKPYFFWFVRKGADGQPVLIVERKETEAKTKGKRAKLEAIKKEHVEGRVEPLGGGKLGFYGEGKVTPTQMMKDFKEKLTKVKDLTSVSELLKGAEIGDLADAPSMAEEDEEVRGKAGRMVAGEDDDDDDDDEETGPTKEDWIKESGRAKDAYLQIKERFGEASEHFAAIKDAQQAAFAEKKKSITDGLLALDDLQLLAKTLLGQTVPPTWDWEATNAQLQLAKKATRPFWFWYCRQGDDDLPILIIERKKQAVTAAAKGARRIAKKKKSVSGWIEKGADGALTFWCEGDELPFAQVERDFKQKLATLDALSSSGPLLRNATFQVVQADTARPPEDDEEGNESTERQGTDTSDTTGPAIPFEEPVVIARETPTDRTDRLDRELDETRHEMLSEENPPGVRIPVLLELWNKAMGAFGQDLDALVEEVRGDPVLAQFPEGQQAKERLDDLEAFYHDTAGPLDDALSTWANTGDEADQPAVVAAAKTALSGFQSRPELKRLEDAIGTPSLHTQQVEVFQTLISTLS